MSNTVENSVRRQQLELLRFEKYLLAAAPAIVALGLSEASAQELRSKINHLDEVRTQFSQDVACEPDFDHALRGVLKSIEATLPSLSGGTQPAERFSSVAQMMTVLDEGHRWAEAKSIKEGIRLIGKRTSDGMQAGGGTPKNPPNLAAFLAKFGS